MLLSFRYRTFDPMSHPAMQSWMADKAEEKEEFDDIDQGTGGFSFDMGEEL